MTEIEDIEDNENCSHVFDTIKEESDNYSETYYYKCQNCDQEQKEVFDLEDQEITEIEILKTGHNK